MANTVIGVRMVDYVRESDGKRIQGMEIVYTFPSKRFSGLNADRKFISMSTINHMGGECLSVDDEIEFTYGQDYKTGKAYINGWRFVS